MHRFGGHLSADEPGGQKQRKENAEQEHHAEFAVPEQEGTVGCFLNEGLVIGIFVYAVVPQDGRRTEPILA